MFIVMTFTIVTHCIQNFIPINPLTIRMVKAKGDVGEAMVFKPRAKSQVKPQIKPMTKVEVVVGLAITEDQFVWLEELIISMVAPKLEEKKATKSNSTSAPTYLGLDFFFMIILWSRTC